MPEKAITRRELVRIIGDVLTEIDVLSSHFDPGTDDRNRLEALRDELDRAQRKLVRSALADNTAEFKARSAPIDDINTALRQTIDNVDKVAKTFETLVKFAGAVQKIAELAP